MPTLRFAEDRSDREMERFKKGEMAARRFCEFSVNERAPYRSFCGAYRKRFGIQRPEDIFDVTGAAMKVAGPIREEFAFDASGKLESKLGIRAEPRSRSRLRRVRQQDSAVGILETLDVDAREGSKGLGENFRGRKRRDAVDMRSDPICQVAATIGETIELLMTVQRQLYIRNFDTEIWRIPRARVLFQLPIPIRMDGMMCHALKRPRLVRQSR